MARNETGMFCTEHQVEVKSSGWCPECKKLKAKKDLYLPEGATVPKPTLTDGTDKLDDKSLASQLTSGYRNANLCPNCNPVPKELKNNETVPNVEEVTLMGWELKKMEDYYLNKFKEKFERPDLTGLARRSALKKAIMRNLNHLSR